MSELTAEPSVPSGQPLNLGAVIVRSWIEGWKAWPWALPLGMVQAGAMALSSYWAAASGGPTTEFSSADYVGFTMLLATFPLAVFLTNFTLKWSLGESVRFNVLWQGWKTISLLVLLGMLVLALFTFLVSGLLTVLFYFLTGMTEGPPEPWISLAAWLVMAGAMALFGISVYCAAHQKLGVRQSLRHAFALGRGERGSLLVLGLLGVAVFPTKAFEWIGSVRFVGEFVWGTLFYPFQMMLFAIAYRQLIHTSEGEGA